MTPSEAIQKINWKPWVLGFLWTVLLPLVPTIWLVIEWKAKWTDPVDWSFVSHQVLLIGGGAAVAYWRKYKALLSLPPIIQQAWDLQQGVGITKTTTTTVGHASDPDPVTITQVQETHATPAADTPAEPRP